MKQRLILAAVMLGLVWATALAVPARPGTFRHTQPDGTELTVQLEGDEYFHMYRDAASGQALLLEADGTLTPYEASDMARARTRAAERRRSDNARRASRMPRLASPAAAPARTLTGTKRGLVLLVSFADKAMTHSRTVLNNQFNQQGFSQANHIGSVSDYFSDQSYGAFDLQFDVVGPLTVSKNMAYYGENDSYGNDKRPATMVAEAVKLAYNQGLTDFSPYDWDGDGYADQVYVIYAGYGEAMGAAANTIWPHQWDLSSAASYGDGPGALTFNGVTVDSYACSNELADTYGTTLSGIGTACHEFSHCLGYPDYYDTDYSGGVGMDYYDIMCSGSYNGKEGYGEQPCGYTAYERWCSGWLEPVELSAPGTVSGMADIGTSPVAYIFYNDNCPTEAFILENRNNTRWFAYCDYNTAGRGLLVTHLDYDANAWANNTPNDIPSHQRFTYVPADKSYDNGSTTDFFPAGATEMTATSHASVNGKFFNRNSAGNYSLAGCDITGIALDSSTKAVSFTFGNADDQPDTPAEKIVYLMGHCNGWPSTAAPAVPVNGKCTWRNVEMLQEPYSYFAFSDAAYADIEASDWPEINAHRYAPTSSNCPVEIGVRMEVIYGVDASWEIAAGVYDIVLDLSSMTMLVAIPGEDPFIPEATETTIVVNEWVANPDTTVSDFGGFTAGDFTLACEKADGYNTPSYYNAGDLRLYAGNQLTVSSTVPMTKIVFNLSAQGLKRLGEVTASTGAIVTQAVGDTQVTWIGCATSVRFTVGEQAIYGSDGESKKAQLDFLSMVVTTDEEAGEPINPEAVETTIVVNEWVANPDTTVSDFGGFTAGDFTLACDQAEGYNTPSYYNWGDLRLYARNQLTVSSTVPMTKIVFNLSAQGLKRLGEVTANVGTIAQQAVGDTQVTWTGSATSVEFTVGEQAIYGSDGESKKAQFDFLSLVITTNGEPDEPDEPVVTPIDEYGSLADWLDARNTSNSRITTPLTAAYQNGYDLYVTDGDAWVLVYGRLAAEYGNGDVIPAGVEGIYKDYNGLPELVPAASTFGEATPGAPVEPAETTIAGVSTDILNHYVCLKGVKLTADPDQERLFRATKNGQGIDVWNRWRLDITAGYNATVIGFVGINEGVAQIYPVSVEFEPVESIIDLTDVVTPPDDADYISMLNLGLGIMNTGDELAIDEFDYSDDIMQAGNEVYIPNLVPFADGYVRGVLNDDATKLTVQFPQVVYTDEYDGMACVISMGNYTTLEIDGEQYFDYEMETDPALNVITFTVAADGSLIGDFDYMRTAEYEGVLYYTLPERAPMTFYAYTDEPNDFYCSYNMLLNVRYMVSDSSLDGAVFLMGDCNAWPSIAAPAFPENGVYTWLDVTMPNDQNWFAFTGAPAASISAVDWATINDYRYGPDPAFGDVDPENGVSNVVIVPGEATGVVYGVDASWQIEGGVYDLVLDTVSMTLLVTEVSDTALGTLEAAPAADAVYYTIDGRPVAQPGHGLYIRLQGGKAAKVIL